MDRGTAVKVTVVVLERQIAALDTLCVEIRLSSGSAVSRTDVIRALVEASEQIDLSGAGCGDQIASILGAKWGAARSSRR